MPWRSIMSSYADRVCLMDDTRQVTYADLSGEVATKAIQLAPWRCVALQMDNGIDWILWDLAAQQQGVVLVPLPPFFTRAQIQHALQSTGVEAIITSQGIRPTGLPSMTLPVGTSKVTFTSGTTGQPKGVCLSAEALWQVAQSLAAILKQDTGPLHMASLPLAVLLENVAGVYTALMLGRSVYLPRLEQLGAQYSNLHRLLAEKNITSLITVPEQLRLLIQQTEEAGGLPALKFVAVGGAKISPELVLRGRCLKLPIFEGYGLSEMASVVALNTISDDHPGAAGKLLPHVKVVVVEGELIFTNPLFLGYVGEAQSPLFHSGDLGEVSPEGLVTVTGRRKNVLITAWGRNISPEWVEAEILQQPAIRQALVFGDGEAALRAFVVSDAPLPEVVQALTQANRSLPDYARVAYFKVVPPFTMQAGTLTGTGRPKRPEILNLHLNKERPFHDLFHTA